MLLRGTSVVDEILAHASRNAVSTIVIGRTRERPIARMFNRTLTQQLLQKGAHFELTIINTPYARARSRRVLEGNATGLRTAGSRDRATRPWPPLPPCWYRRSRERWFGFDDLSLVFITAVLFVSVRTRMSVAVYAAVLCFLAYNFFFITPRYTLYIAAGKGCHHGHHVPGRGADLRAARESAAHAGPVAARAHAHTEALQGLGQQLATAADEAQVLRAGLRALRDGLDAETIVLTAEGATGRLVEAAGEPKGLALDLQTRAAADWCLAHQQPAGRGTDTLQGVDGGACH